MTFIRPWVHKIIRIIVTTVNKSIFYLLMNPVLPKTNEKDSRIILWAYSSIALSGWKQKEKWRRLREPIRAKEKKIILALLLHQRLVITFCQLVRNQIEFPTASSIRRHDALSFGLVTFKTSEDVLWPSVFHYTLLQPGLWCLLTRDESDSLLSSPRVCTEARLLFIPADATTPPGEWSGLAINVHPLCDQTTSGLIILKCNKLIEMANMIWEMFVSLLYKRLKKGLKEDVILLEESNYGTTSKWM